MNAAIAKTYLNTYVLCLYRKIVDSYWLNGRKHFHKVHVWKLAVRITPNATEDSFLIWIVHECFASSAESRRITTKITKRILSILCWPLLTNRCRQFETAIPNWTRLCRPLATLCAKSGRLTNDTQMHSSKPATSGSLTQFHVSYSSMIGCVNLSNSRIRSPSRRQQTAPPAGLWRGICRINELKALTARANNDENVSLTSENEAIKLREQMEMWMTLAKRQLAETSCIPVNAVAQFKSSIQKCNEAFTI